MKHMTGKRLRSCCILFAAVAATACGQKYKSLSPFEFKSAVAMDSLQVVDLRTAREFSESRIPGAVNLDYSSEDFLDEALSSLKKDRGVGLYCRSEALSAEAARLLEGKGFDVTVLDGGVVAWSEAGLDLADENDFLVSVGKPAPDFTVELYNRQAAYAPDYVGGSAVTKKVSLSSLKGKVVMLQFTASWCGVCREEMPHIEAEIWKPLMKNPDFALIAIDRDEPASKIEAQIKATGITYDIGFDPGAEIYNLYALPNSGITRNVLIDKSGTVVFLTRLYDEQQFMALKNKIAELLRVH